MSDLQKPGFFSELIHYAGKNKRWWLMPLLVLLCIFGLLVVVAEVAPVISPFIYTLF